MSSKHKSSDGDWTCSDVKCNNLNFARRSSCNRCGKEREPSIDSKKNKQSIEIGKAAAEKSHGLFSADDWQCSKCGNVNWARRNTCNMCNAPKVGEVEERTGYGGGFNEREGVEYIRRPDSDDEFDEFGFRKKKFRGTLPPAKSIVEQPIRVADVNKEEEKEEEEEDDDEDDDDDDGDLSKYDLCGDEDEDDIDLEEKNGDSSKDTKAVNKKNTSSQPEAVGHNSRSRSMSKSNSRSHSGSSRSSRSRSYSRDGSHSSNSRSQSPKSKSGRKDRSRSHEAGRRKRSFGSNSSYSLKSRSRSRSRSYSKDKRMKR